MSQLSITEIATQSGILKALVTDLAGGFKEIMFPLNRIVEIVGSGVAYDGSSFQGINTINSSDSILKGDEKTLIKIPGNITETDTLEYWIICDILDTKSAIHPNCARSKLIELQNILSDTWDQGQLYMGAEPEAFFVEDQQTIGEVKGKNSNYFNPRDPKSSIIAEIYQTLEEMGFEIERAHTECGEDQFEINWKYDKAQYTADRIQIYKLATHKIARNYGYDVTFLPKPYPTRNGSGMHCHISVSNNTSNLFYSDDDTNNNFSDKSLKFIAGILKNSKAICAVSNSTEASYARLVPGFEAPCVVAIGACNRSAACRIPALSNAEIKKFAIRIELRFPDPLTNPYLLAACFIAGGLDGIIEETKFKGFTEEDLFSLSVVELEEKGYELLPRNLWEAYQYFSKNKALKKYLGESIFRSHLNLLLDEIDSCQPFANVESMRRHYFA